MKQTLEEAAQSMAYGKMPDWGGLPMLAKKYFIKGAEWQAKQSPWISVNERMPEENEDIIIMCEHGAIFNGAYSNDVWFCMDGYINDIYKGNPTYSLMSSIPPLWKPIAWMSIPKFNE